MIIILQNKYLRGLQALWWDQTDIQTGISQQQYRKQIKKYRHQKSRTLLNTPPKVQQKIRQFSLSQSNWI